MTVETIFLALVAAAPAITAVCSIIAAVVKIIKSNKKEIKAVVDELTALKTEVAKTEEYENLKAQLKEVHRENVELKKRLNEVLTKIDKIQRED